MRNGLRSAAAALVAAAMVICMLPSVLFASGQPGYLSIALFPETLPDGSCITEGRTVRISCALPCKLGYLSGGRYVSLKGVSLSGNESSYYVPEGIDELAVVVVGDANGDGRVSNSDSTKIKAYLGESAVLTDEQLFAADVNYDGRVSNADAIKIKAFLKEDYELLWDVGPAGVYTVEYHLQTKIGLGGYAPDPALAKSMKGVAGTEVGAERIEICGYVYDAGNENNVTSGIVAEDGSLVLKLYYRIDADENGQPDDEEEFLIVVSADASPREIYAAETLQEYLYETDGRFCEIVTDDRPSEGFRFCIGSTSVYDTSADMEGKPADSYVIAPIDRGLAIFGAGGRGTLYGVHDFLENCCGFKCYAWYPAMVMTSDRMIIPKEKREYVPFFEYRNTDWRSGWMPVYSVSHKLNGELQTDIPEFGGNIPYLGGTRCHTLSTIFCSSDEYFASHPEYFALHGGVRVPGQLCLTNEEVYEIVLDEVLNILETEHDPDADLQIISLSQADNMDYCECDRCRALDEANGSHAGSMIEFVNRVADVVKESGYDNVAIDTFAYMYSRKAPSKVIPRENVIVRLCTFECCFSHTLDDPACEQNRELIKDLEDWSQICSRIYIWDYTTNYAYTLGIFPDFHTLQRNMQCFYEHGVKGVYEEGNYYVDSCDTEFGELRTYLIAELLADPYCEYDEKMLEFCNNYYGAGGRYVKEIIDELTGCIKGHVDLICRMGDTFSIDEEEAEKIDALWDAAESASEGSEDALAALRRSRLSWRYVKAVLGLREFSGTLEENRDAREAFYNDLRAHGVRMIDEWTWIEEDFSEYEHIPVEEWEYAARFFYLLYDSNGGTDGPSGQWAFIDRISDIVPVRSGYTFLGWAGEADAQLPEYLPGDPIYLEEDLTLYAVWEAE